eukprot:4616254-Alexandrium_andersonii.AAC.1
MQRCDLSPALAAGLTPCPNRAGRPCWRARSPRRRRTCSTGRSCGTPTGASACASRSNSGRR